MTAAPAWDELVRVGQIARPHGLRGQVVVDADTDFPDFRFRPGAVLYVEASGSPGRLVIASARFHQGRPVLGFEGVETIEDAERLGRVELRAEPEGAELPEDAFFHRDLVGCEVVTVAGEALGTVRRVEGPMASSVLTVEGPRGEVLVPFVRGICVEIAPEAGRIVIDPPEGLIALNR